MVRVGINPARNRVTAYRPARVTIAMLVYVPYLEGYFQDRLDVLKLSMASLIKHTDVPYDLMVMDNGSCEQVKDYLRSLQGMGAIRYLITARENVGKIGALKILFRAAPGEVIAYTDDDIFFYPGWLQEHLRLLDGFPNVGMVSGCAVRTLFDHGIAANLAFAQSVSEASLQRGQHIPEQWEAEWAESYGRDVEAHLAAVRSLDDLVLSYRGLKAYAVANHNQFVSPRQLILNFLPETWSGRLMGEMNELDDAVANGGYLRLSTFDRTTKHIGNTISVHMVEEASRFSINTRQVSARSLGLPRRPMSQVLASWRPIRWLLQGVYNRLFWILSGQSGGWYQAGRGGSR